MAASKKKGSSKKKSFTPAVRYLRYNLTNSATPGTETSHYLDLARDLSAVNRRLMRQGRVYHIRKITILSPDTTNAPAGGVVSAAVIPDSWPSRQGWKRAFQTWQKMQKEATTATSGVVAGTWNDFKVYLDNAHRSASIVSPKDNGGSTVALGEWEYTQLVIPDLTGSGDDQFYMHMLGNHDKTGTDFNSVGLIQSYSESRATVSGNSPNTPGTVSSDPLVNVFDYGTTIDDVVQLMETEADDPPYDIDNYPGTGLNMPNAIVVQEGALDNGRLVLGGFSAICGLVELETKSAVPSDQLSVLVEIAPGNYRGVNAESI